MSRPNINIPTEFAINGDKTDFSQAKITNGFDRLQPDVLPGDNLNKLIDDTYKGLNGVLELYEGCVLYDSTVTYTNKSLVFNITNDGIKLYHSLQNGNINHALTDKKYWEEVKLGGSSLPLFSFMWSDHLINDMQYLRADAFSWQDGKTYSLPYNKLVQEYATGETVTENGITFKRSTNGFKIADKTQEQAILELYNNTGVAWYYILDTTNKRFKLPRTKYGFVGLRNGVGGYVPESLPNIKASWKRQSNRNVLGPNDILTGAFKRSPSESTSQTFGDSGTAMKGSDLLIDAHEANTIYQDNAPVQQRATQMYLYFYVGEYTQTAVEQTAGLNAELFNGKVDLNFNNMNPSQTAKNTIISWVMPDYSAGISLQTSTTELTYTAPTKGVAILHLAGGTNRYITNITVNNNPLPYPSKVDSGEYRCIYYIPLDREDVLDIKYNSNATVKTSYFYPLKGAK